MRTGLEIEIRQPLDYLDVVRLEAHIKKIVRAANDPRVVAFPLKTRKPWCRPPKLGGNNTDAPPTTPPSRMSATECRKGVCIEREGADKPEEVRK